MNMKNLVTILTLVLSLLLYFQTSSSAQDSTSLCFRSAQGWINELSHAKSRIMYEHARTRCNSSAQWLHNDNHSQSKTMQGQLCRDLVLIWTHKECIYFRDYITPDAYAPCKEWSREMYRQCMINNDDWFYPE